MIYVALFKGINVGGKHIVKMAELKEIFIELGLTGAKSYIQSGNVVFESKADPRELKEKLAAAFVEKFGFQCAILLRSSEEIKTLINALPFTEAEIKTAKEANPEVEHLYVYFLDRPDLPEKLSELLDGYTGPDLSKSGPGAVYILSQGSIRLSALALRLNKEFPDMTARNWKTVNKIYEMMLSF